MKTGIIAQVLGKTPASVGYDLIQKNPKQKFCKGPQDYELLFRGFTSTHPAKVESVLENFDRSLMRITEDAAKTNDIVESEELNDMLLHDLNGEVIKAIVMRDGKENAALNGEHDQESQAIVQELLTGWANLRLSRIDVEREVADRLRKGTLDVYVEEGKQTLKVYQGEESWSEASAMVKPEQIKASLFFLLELHYKMERFKEAINCEVQQGNYILAYEKGELEFYMADGSEPTEFELKVMQDIKKIKM